MKNKDIQNHPEWSELAKRVDDLRYVIMTYGHQLPKSALTITLKTYHKLRRKCESLEKDLNKQGWSAFC